MCIRDRIYNFTWNYKQPSITSTYYTNTWTEENKINNRRTERYEDRNGEIMLEHIRIFAVPRNDTYTVYEDETQEETKDRVENPLKMYYPRN